ncbi:MAG: type VI secretion system tip protein TssI/VgrG [Byssovorax sp.]
MTTPPRNLAAHIASGDALDVRRFAAEERMSSLFEVTLVALCDNPNIDFDAVVGQPASFRLDSGASTAWTGICKHIEQIAVEERGLSTYELTFVPTLWLLTQRRNHRMFQQMSELDIVTKLLAEWGIPTDLRISGVYKKRKYRVQYAESDFAFLARMLEDAGISFHFASSDAGTTLVLADAPQSSEPRSPAIPFRDQPTASDREHVTRVRVGQEVRPGRITVRDHDPRLPASYPLLASAAAAGSGVEGRLEQFYYEPGAFLFGTDQGESTPFADDKGKTRSDEKEGGALARRRLDAGRSGAKICVFETSAVDLAPGVVIGILDHPRSDLAPSLPQLIIASTHEGTSDGVWTHRCEAQSAAAAYRPALTSVKPKVSGVESATVVGSAGEEIHTDEFGRVRVHFHWDRESGMDSNSSCWIHVSQSWGGAGYGGSNLPRVGQEVLVDFLSGDPDRPVIVGRVYTNLQKVPYKLPENKTQSGLKSNSTHGTGGYNEVMFEDAAGRELVRMQAEKDLHKLVKNDEIVTIGRDRTKLVKNDDALTVDNDRTKLVKNDEDVTIGRDRTKLVKNDESVTIGNDRTKIVQNDEQSTIGNNRTKLVKNDEVATIGRDRTKHVQNDENVTIGNDHTKHVKNSETVTIGKNLVKTVLQNAREVTGLARSVVVGLSRATQVGLTDSIMAGKSISMMVSPPGEEGLFDVTSYVMLPASHDLKTAGGAELMMEGKTITLDMGAKITMSEKLTPPLKDAKKTIVLESGLGPTITLDDKIVLSTGGGATITMEGGKITIHATEGIVLEADAGDLLIKGAPKVKINPSVPAPPQPPPPAKAPAPPAAGAAPPAAPAAAPGPPAAPAGPPAPPAGPHH